jgi:pyruvate-formate lyase-activating enzyme
MTSGGAPTITLDTGRRCNTACLICAQAGDEAPVDAMLEQLARIPAEAQQACFGGGEPTLHAELEGWLRAARDAGLERVGVQTNGAGFDSARAKALRDAGLTEVELTLHAPRADAHDFLTATPGSFERVSRALDAAQEAGLGVRVASVLARSNYRLAPELSVWLAERGVHAQAYFVPRVAGRLRSEVARLLPALGMALPRALEAASLGRRAGLRVFLSGAPACMLGPHQALALPSARRHHPASCDDCNRRGSCPGVDPSYGERFGFAELSAARARTDASERSERPDWRRAFAGVGTLV